MSTRTVSPFIAFCHAKREEVKAANPRANMGRMLAALWKNMSESERMAYSNQRKSTRIANQPENQQEVRRSSRLRNKSLGLDFWGLKR
jgi:hypothetical protein